MPGAAARDPGPPRATPTRTTVHLPVDEQRAGPVTRLREIAAELRANRWLLRQFFGRDLRGAYRQSWLGANWALAAPLITLGVVVLLSRSGILAGGSIRAPYPVWAATGLMIWQILAVGLLAGAGSLASAGRLVSKINFSRKSLVLASCLRAAVPFSVQLAVVAGLLVAYGMAGSLLRLPVALLLLVPLCLLTVGLALLLALFNSVVRDVSHALPGALTLAMLLTPVVYAQPRGGLLSTLARANPLHYLVSAPRGYLLDGELAAPGAYAAVAATSVLVALFGLLAFHSAERKIAERI